MTNPPLPPSGNEERWNGQRTVPVDPSGSHPPRLFPHPPIGYGQAQAGDFQRPLAPPVFVQNQFTDTYGLPQNHFPGLRFRANEHRYRVPPAFPPSSNSTEGLRSFVQNMSHLNDDGRHHRPSSMPPLRRPPHWEDDPYAASSFRDSDAAGDRGAFPGPHGHCCQSELHHYHRYPVYAGPPSSFCGDGHRSSHHPGFWTCNGYPHHCTYRNSCGSPCAESDNRQNSTLTYIGPSSCGGNVHCGHCLPSCGHVAPVVPSSQLQTQPNTEDTILPAGRHSREQPSGNTRKSWGDVRRWLGKRFSAAKRVIPKTFKRSNTRRQTEDDSERPQEPESQVTATLNPESPSEAVPTVATTSSQIGENSNNSNSYETTTGLNPSSSGDDTIATHESIPRPVSSASTCQCNPSTVTLHRMLQHKPFDTFELQWNITLPPKAFVFWASTPEEILSGRPVSFPDDALFSEPATTPPIRHMFINALGDFPLERCQGDPDPSRSKDKERHMYVSSGSRSISIGMGMGIINNTTTTSDEEKIELRTLPWPIRITGTSPSSNYITLWDIFRTIHLNFQQYMQKEEYELYIIERKRLIASAYHQRKRVLDGKRNYRPMYGQIPETEIMENYIEDGYMRCDYLGSSLIFRGLEANPDGVGYTLFLGPH